MNFGVDQIIGLGFVGLIIIFALLVLWLLVPRANPIFHQSLRNLVFLSIVLLLAQALFMMAGGQ